MNTAAANTVTWKRVRAGLYQSHETTKGGAPLFVIENVGFPANSWELTSVFTSRTQEHEHFADAKQVALNHMRHPKCASMEHGGMVLATRRISYLFRGQGLPIVEAVCRDCAESYGNRPVLTDFKVLPLAS